MKADFFPSSCHTLRLALALTLASFGIHRAQATIVTMDFSLFPDGTPLEEIGLFEGIVNLKAQVGIAYGIFDPDQPYGAGGGEVWMDSGLVSGGQLRLGWESGIEIPATAWPVRGQSKLTITPLQPVTGIAFSTITSPWWVGYSYEGVDRDGVAFAGSGPAQPHASFGVQQTTVLAAPTGGHFTQLVLWNWDYSYLVNGLATPLGAFGVTSVTLRVDEATGQCPLAAAYWKNHPEAWPLNALMIGSKHYDQAELQALLKGGTMGDASLVLASQFICASLNIANGAYAPPQVTDTMSEAELGLYYYPGKLAFDTKRSSEQGRTLLELADVLKQFNSGSMTGDCVR